MKTKYIIISLSLIAFMGFWMFGGVLLNSGIHPMGILGIPLFIIQSFQDHEEIDESTYMLSDKPLQRVLDHCEWQRKLATGEIPERNADGSWNGVNDIGLSYQNDTHYIDNNTCEWETPPRENIDTSDKDLKSKAYITNCDETLHKKELPDFTIENSTHNYDMQYCKWELKYPDLTLITNNNLMNDYPYCAELFDTLFDYYESIRDDCGMTRYNEDGTPRGICEPEFPGARVPRDINMIKSGCTNHYADWAYQTKHNDDVFYLFDREINVKIHSNLDEQIKIIDNLCEDNEYLNVEPNIKFRNNTHWIDTDHCALNTKDTGVVIERNYK